MPLPIIICDDSSFARKQVARALPKGWDVEVSFAGNGREAVEAIRAGKGDLIFLDLTMPEMDGFEVLEYIRREDLPTLAIVISGDVQEESRRRVLELGALTFIKKPVDAVALCGILDEYGLLSVLTGSSPAPLDVPSDFRDWCQELANVAMGRAADLLAQVIAVPVELSIPRVATSAPAELARTLEERTGESGTALVTQGFIGGGIAGETMVLFHETDTRHLGPLFGYEQELDSHTEVELLMEVSNILIGAILKGLSDLLDLGFSQGHPVVHTDPATCRRRLGANLPADSDILSIEFSYAIGRENIRCDQLILFTPPAAGALARRADYSMGGA